MKAKRILQLSVALTLGLVIVSFTSAFGCLMDDNDDGARCISFVRAKSDPIVIATGENPGLAMTPTGEWQYIAPQSSVWYKISDGGLQLTVWIDANGLNGLAMEIYAPDQTDWSKPIGRGSFNKFEPHDLFWTGRSRAIGSWYAMVRNDNPIAIPYNLNYSRSKHSVADRCSACHGSDIEWDRCVSAPGSNFCDQLRDEFMNGK